MRNITPILLGSFLIALAGCSAEKPKERVAVTGTVTYLGKPLSGAMVQFIPVDAAGEAASARTDAAGKYELVSTKGGSGTAPGEYKVVVSRILDPKGKELPPDASPFSSDGKESLPPVYSSREGTTLKATVPAAPSATIDFPLTSQSGAASGSPAQR